MTHPADPAKYSPVLDRNKSAITQAVTLIAAAWMDGIGFKPIETEVGVAAQWVADLASFIYPTPTEAGKLRITGQAKRWLGESRQGEFDMDGALSLYGYGPFTAIIEVKTALADYRKDLAAKFLRPELPAHLCFLAYQHGLLKPEDLPDGWYGLETSTTGSKLIRVHRNKCRLHPQHPGQVADVIAQVAIRRDHRTRYRAMRDWLKARRALGGFYA